MKPVEVDQCVERMAVELGRGLSLEDLDGVLLSYSSQGAIADRVRVNFLLSKKVPADVSAWQLQHGISTAVRPVSVPANQELGMLGRVCVPLLVRGFRVGYLWVQQNSEERHAAAILQQLPKVRDELELLGELLLDSNTAESEYRRQRESGFLEACTGTAAAIGGLAGWREISGRGPWQLAVLLERGACMAPSEDPHASALLHRTAALQATVGVNAVLFSAGTATHALVLLRRMHGHHDHDQVRGRYRGELDKRSGHTAAPVLLGLSEPFGELEQLPAAYREARHAVQASAVDAQLGETVAYRNIGVYQYLGAEGAASASAPAHSAHFRELRAVDRNEELLPLLELLYDHDCSVQEVAQALHLHRSTVYNRLAKIRSLTGADPLNGRVRLELHLAFKAARWAARPRF